MSVYIKQVGGTHYKAPIQNWDVMEAYDVDYLSATSSKYLARWRDKGTPKVDLLKSVSYLRKAIACREGYKQITKRTVPMIALQEWMDVAHIHPEDQPLLRAILCSGTQVSILSAVITIETWVERLP